jgi:hypothetical protein
MGNGKQKSKKCRGTWHALERLTHLSEKEIDKLIEEEPDITIGGYLAFLREINDIENSIENESRS